MSTIAVTERQGFAGRQTMMAQSRTAPKNRSPLEHHHSAVGRARRGTGAFVDVGRVDSSGSRRELFPGELVE